MDPANERSCPDARGGAAADPGASAGGAGSPDRAGPWQLTRNGCRAIVSGIIGLSILVLMALASGGVGRRGHLPLSGAVIGLALMALVLLLAERFHGRLHRSLTRHLGAPGRGLISHMGLLFIPAGVGIITEGEKLRHEWLPLAVGLAGSTVIGLMVTGWLMHRFAPKAPMGGP